jgi:hypothetical protein
MCGRSIGLSFGVLKRRTVKTWHPETFYLDDFITSFFDGNRQKPCDGRNLRQRHDCWTPATVEISVVKVMPSPKTMR